MKARICFLLSLFVLIGFNPIILIAERCSILRVDNYLFPNIKIYVEVLDNHGNSFIGLTRNNFKVIEDGKEIEDFETSFIYRSNDWLDIVIAIDRSGSMKGEPFEKSKIAAIDLLRQLSASDKVAFLAYDDKVDLWVDFTRDKKFIINKIKSLKTRKDTAFYDALSLSLDKLGKSSSPRKVIFSFTDGKDTSSQIKIKDLIKKLSKKDILCFLFGMGKSVNQAVLEKISYSSRHKYFYNPDLKKIGDVYESIVRNLGFRYIISYKSQVVPSRGNHVVEVQYKNRDVLAKDRRYFLIHSIYKRGLNLFKSE